jgi:ABC-type multidrug transport system ATPase subunit
MLDEPTSGLDSLTSYIIVDHLRRLAKNEGKTVLMTIHQPNSDIYAMFDRLFLMVEGRIVYQGPASTAMDYFSSNFGVECPTYQNAS